VVREEGEWTAGADRSLRIGGGRGRGAGGGDVQQQKQHEHKTHDNYEHAGPLSCVQTRPTNERCARDFKKGIGER